MSQEFLSGTTLLRGGWKEHGERREGGREGKEGLAEKEGILMQILTFPYRKKSASNFDREFTKEVCRLSPVDPPIIAAIEPEAFEGFSFINPEVYVQN